MQLRLVFYSNKFTVKDVCVGNFKKISIFFKYMDYLHHYICIEYIYIYFILLSI